MFTRPRVLLLVSVVALGAWLWVGAKPFTPEPPPPTPADEFTVSGPFTHGNLTVFLLHGPDAERSRPVFGLDEALAKKCAVVHETGSVNELTVENTSEEDDLLLLSGDIVKGGRQDRVLQTTMILPPKSGKVPVRSFCVEQSRWTKRGGEDDTRFGGNDSSIAGADLKKAVRLAGSQGEVWSTVQVQQAALSKNVGTVVNSPASPSSLQLALENDKVQAEVAKIREAITKQVGEPSGAVGFVTVVNGQVTGAEAFGSHALFRKAWAKAVNAAAVEAVAEKPTRPFSEMTTAGVKTFLASAGREQQESKHDYRRAPSTVFDDSGEASVRFETTAWPDRRRQVDEIRESLIQARGRNRAAGGELRPMDSQVQLFTLSRDVQTQAFATGDDGNVIDFTAQWVTRSAAPGAAHGQPGPATGSTIVEYREKGNGAVIHKSFLPK